jgi:hypothetical protein
VAGLALAAAVLVPGTAVLGMSRDRLRGLPLPTAWTRWLAAAVHEEEGELAEAIRPRRGTWRDGLAAGLALAAVVAASIVMEETASALGSRYAVAGIVTGGLVLAVVTSLPNAVSAVYLAMRGRGAAVLSTALSSNAINVVAGLLVPASLTGLGARSGTGMLVAVWYAGLTLAALLLAYRGHGLRRLPGAVIIGGYFAFVAALLAAVAEHAVRPAVAVIPAAVFAIATALLVARPSAARPSPGRATAGWWRRESLLPGWSVGRLWRLSLLLCCVIAACDAATGPHVVLMGLLIAGPCCALLTARWAAVASVGCFAVLLAVLLGLPDQIFATLTQYAFVAAVAVVGMTASVGAAILQRQRF